MKTAAFDYHAPREEAEALALLARFGDEGRVLAGGQSLVPTMAFRMARPAVLVDINRVAGLAHITAAGAWLRIGALARHADFEAPVREDGLGRLLALVARHIAHAPIRTRGTFCGSLAHADPASEWCATTLALGGRMLVVGPGGERLVAAEDWFQGIFTTALRPGELLREVQLPIRDAGWRYGFAEFSRRSGDFALAMAVVALRLKQGLVREARIALGGVGGMATLLPGAAGALLGHAPDMPAREAAAAAAAAACAPHEDVHAPAEYRRELVQVMVRRALAMAAS